MGREPQIETILSGSKISTAVEIQHYQTGNNFEDVSFGVRGHAKFVSPQAHPNIGQAHTSSHLYPNPRVMSESFPNAHTDGKMLTNTSKLQPFYLTYTHRYSVWYHHLLS